MFDRQFWSGTLHSPRVPRRPPSRRVGKAVSSHVFTVRLSDDAEGPRVGVGNVCDGVSVQSGLVGNGANLLNGLLGAAVGSAGKGHLERLVVTEGYVSPGAQASGRLLGRGGGILRRCRRNVLIQPLGHETKSVTICFHFTSAT